MLACIAALSISRAAPAEPPPTPVVVNVLGRGVIRLVVADGASRPCDAADNRVLFDGRVTAGENVKLSSQRGTVCVDHTYGTFRDSQWAGAVIWSGSTLWPGSNQPVLHGTVSTDEP